jgi:multidrug efflux pump subunit AcrA (membrane-fusion protein)
MNQSSSFHLPRGGWVTAALASALVLSGCGHSAPAPVAAAPKGVVVEAVDAITRTQPITVDTFGHVDAADTVSFVPLVNARVMALLVGDGAEVKAGDPLIRLDNRSYAAVLARMQGEKVARAAQVAALQSRAASACSRPPPRWAIS